MQPLEELQVLLRPAGGGLHLVSTGKAEQEALQRKLYGVSTEAEVRRRFEEALARLPFATGVLLGMPSDVGAGFRRGANLGPQALRLALLEKHGKWLDAQRAHGLVDVGDVFVVPQLQHDAMLSEAQLEATRAALYPEVAPAERAALPVSPLSIAERAWALMFALNPKLKPFVLGGDHSTALPAVLALQQAAQAQQLAPLGIVQSDAHTDLLETRLGVKYCFATWSWHANEALGRGGRLTQVGIRASGKDQVHWEMTTGVRQFWAHDILAHPDLLLDEVVAHLKETGVKGVYVSNDIDGTDARYADATGTPEPGGLEPDWVVGLIRRLGREVGVLGGDVMEVAPPLGRDGGARTVALGARYLKETVEAALGTRT